MKYTAECFLKQDEQGRDILEKARLEETANSEAEAMLKGTMKPAASQAEKQNELDELTYIISHDLQEPLRMISSYVQLLDKRYGEKLDENAKEYIKYAVDGSNRLKKMMDDLLTYSRIGRQNFRIEPVTLSKSLEKAEQLAAIKYKSEEYNIKKSIGSTDEIFADKELLLKLFYNMIDNSLKFNRGTKPEIEIASSENDTHWIISVKDNGVGIDKEYHGKIFGIFQKLHNHSEYPGSGIGLAICEKIAKKHQGEIWVHSELGKGAAFYISIAKNKTEQTA